MLVLVRSLPPATARDVPLYLPRSTIEDEHVPGQVRAAALHRVPAGPAVVG